LTAGNETAYSALVAMIGGGIANLAIRLADVVWLTGVLDGVLQHAV